MSASAPTTPSGGSGASNQAKRETNCLPQARVKTIMKSSPDVDVVSQESLYLITRATIKAAPLCPATHEDLGFKSKIVLLMDHGGSEGAEMSLEASHQELFIMYMAKLASRNGDDVSISYGDLAAVVQRKESMEFLHDIIPKKITYAEYQKLMEDEQSDEEDIF